MGWSGGSILFDEVIKTMIKENIDPKKRKNIYRSLITAFEDIGDCDNLCECRWRDAAFDDVWNEIYGEDE